jgi:hypothetical protein
MAGSVTPFVGPGTLILGETATADVISCDLTEGRISDVSPTYSEVAGCGTVSKQGAPDLELTVTAVQDLIKTSGLLRVSWAHHNQVMPFIFIPGKNGAVAADISASNPGVTGNVLVSRLDIGGSSTALATSTKTWKIQGDVSLIETPPQ